MILYLVSVALRVASSSYVLPFLAIVFVGGAFRFFWRLAGVER